MTWGGIVRVYRRVLRIRRSRLSGEHALTAMGVREMETWDLWFPEAGATGLPFARGRLDPTDVLWAHAVPATLDVAVRDEQHRVIASGCGLQRQGERLPLTRLARRGDTIVREDRWPTQADLGTPVILPGGEVGILTSWWNADDGSAWRWQVEFYNHR